MFADAYKKAIAFTRPVITSLRFFNKSVGSGCGAFVVINEDGWILTAGHIFDSFVEFKKNEEELLDHRKKVQSIEESSELTTKHKAKERNKLKTNPKWITEHSFWWNWNGVEAKDVKVLRKADIAIARLEPFKSTMITDYPIFKDPSKIDVGTSLCKLGFPFHDVKTDFDERENRFRLLPGTLPLPFFPIEGIYTRNIFVGKSDDGKFDIKFLETSSPGLRGQSGGPIFDTKGTVWAIQSQTRHYPLGFSPIVNKDGREIEENQFLNVGVGVHPETIASFLTTNGIDFRLSDY